MCGDGGFFLNLTELWTAVQEKVDIVFVVMNDKGYGVIKHIQSTLYGGRHYFGDLLGPDLEKLCEVAGMHYVRVDRGRPAHSAYRRLRTVFPDPDQEDRRNNVAPHTTCSGYV